MYYCTATYSSRLWCSSQSHISNPAGHKMPCVFLQHFRKPRKLWNAPTFKFISFGPQRHSSLPFAGQGLKKNAIVIRKSKWLDRFVKNRLKDQEWGRKNFPIFPDVRNYIKGVIFFTSAIIIGWIFYPDFVDRKSAIEDPTLQYNSAIELRDEKTAVLKIYSTLPLRAFSRAWGRALQGWEVPAFLRQSLFGLYSKFYDVDLNEAVNSDLKSYLNFSEFFRRPIKAGLRPVDEGAEIVSPSDGKILHFGKVVNGEVEQVKGVTYSLQKFLGPLHMEPLHNEWGKKDVHRHNWCSIPLDRYMKALMHNPTENDLYHCVIYLAPGDYHRFHSPTDWIVQHRRHFPGDLLSVNPKIAAKVPSLFVLNERVALFGKWRHGFFSMTAVGATSVGSVQIYGDVTLKTNRPKRVYGGYYDATYDNVPASKGMGMGEFNLGSTIVLIFEAPKDFQYSIEPDEKICYGKALQKV